MYHPKIHKILKCQAIKNFTHIMYTKSFSLKTSVHIHKIIGNTF